MVKFYAKICDMCDASRGSLSSYAYILLMLHYLQQCKPPVIPVLQVGLVNTLSRPHNEVQVFRSLFRIAFKNRVYAEFYFDTNLYFLVNFYEPLYIK